MFKIFTILASIGLCLAADPKFLDLSPEKPSMELTADYSLHDNSNFYELRLTSADMVKGKNLFIVLESENPEFKLSLINGEKSHKQRNAVIMDVTTFSGNIGLVMSDTFFNSQLDFFRTTGRLRFMIVNKTMQGKMDYKLKVSIGDRGVLEMGRIYTTRIDYMLNDFKVDLVYNGTNYPDLEKVRFQLTSVKQKPDYSLIASLEHEGSVFMLNSVFKKTVGGALSGSKLPVCKATECVYTLTVHVEKVKTLNIESFLVGKIETLSINHYDDYYDRVYSGNVTTTYKLPYEASMADMDISISLIPVTGTSGLYVNAKTLPTCLTKYNWIELGRLAKRITVRWDELKDMMANESDLYISVNCDKPGEYLLKIDAHERGFRGRLTSGVIEAGFVKYQEISNYLYTFEVFETQEITFDVKMVVFAGEANLYVKKCNAFADCKLTEDTIKDSSVVSVENNHNTKTIKNTFTCQHRAKAASTLCEFIIGVKGSENHGTHYDISIQENRFHRLIMPGHPINVNLNPDETTYLKFSYPKSANGTKLYLSVEPIWGDFAVHISKKVEFPSMEDSGHTEEFHAAKAGLYNSTKMIPITPTLVDDFTIQGLYYISVVARTSCALNIKFFDKSENELTLHTLSAGSQVRGEISKADEVVYYTIKLALTEEQASTVTINLTPLKGSFMMFANRNGKMPTMESHDLASDSNHLELSYKEYNEAKDEYIIGVQLSSKEVTENERYQFMISFTYSNKPLMLNPGLISSHTIRDSNYFLLEVSKEMTSLLVIKGVTDGYNIDLCAKFASSERIEQTGDCDYSANERKVAVSVNHNDLKSFCVKRWETGKCFVQLSLKGNNGQKFTLGYTFNDHPFQLIKNHVANGPIVTKNDYSINYVYHVDPKQPVGIYFNSKGRNASIFTKIVKADDFDEKADINFPNAASFDKDHTLRTGYITNVFYDASVVEMYGPSPEILIAVRMNGGVEGSEPFDVNYSYVLQSSLEGREVLRTETHSEIIQEEEWNYYTFYNNGNSDSLRVYVSTTVATKLEVGLSRGKQVRPPFTNKPVISQIGIGSVVLDIKGEDLKKDSKSASEGLKGYFTLSVKSSTTCKASIFWNNKEDLNFLELTPNEPSTMVIDKGKKLYFSAYVKDNEAKSKKDRGEVSLYIKSSVQADVYILKSLNGDLKAPSSENFEWKASVSHAGGVTVLKIPPTDPNYCIECSYIGFVDTTQNGQLTLLIDVEHENMPISLSPGVNFPFNLPARGRKLFRMHNPDSSIMGLTISMLSGYVSVYTSATADVSPTNYKEIFNLESTLTPHKSIVISPSKYDVTTAHDYFILVANNRPDASSFVMTVSKNSDKTPIEIGMSKFLTLAPQESADFYYKPLKEENAFEVKLEVKQVADEALIKKVLDRMTSILDVYTLSSTNEKHLLKYKAHEVYENIIYIKFDITENIQSTFLLHLYNPIESTVSLTVEMTHMGYKLMNLNNYSVDQVSGNDNIIYEAYSIPDKFLFVDIRMCLGDVKISFYQNDYEKIGKDDKVDYKTIKDANSFIHYIKLDSRKAFLKVENMDADQSIFELNLFNEQDLDGDPYTQIVQGDGGKITVETDNNVVRFKPVTLNSTYKDGFKHKIDYTVYLTTSFKAMRFAKNCGKHLLSKAFNESDVLSFTKTIIFNNEKNSPDAKNQIEIHVPGLVGGTKYFGVVVAKAQLLPLDPGYISALRRSKIYYDEFVIMTPRLSLPINLLLGSLMSLGFLICLFWIIKSYLMGEINKLYGLEKLTNFEDLDNGVFGSNLVSILETEYYEEKINDSTSTASKHGLDLDHPPTDQEEQEDDGHGHIELTDHNDSKQPLA